MNNTLTLLLLITGSISVIATIPQIVKLIKTKQSEELSLISWTIWLMYQTVSFLYSIQIKSIAYTIINGVWICFYVLMVVLIIRYRKRALVLQ